MQKNYLLDQYNSQFRYDLMTKNNYKDIYSVPKITKIVISMGIKEAISNKNSLLAPFFALMLITGQKPIPTKAKKSIAMFKLRKGMYSGIKVTLKNELMYDFLMKIILFILPKNKEFTAFSKKQVNKFGNLSFGIENIFSFLEAEKQLDNNKLNTPYGFNISIVTTAKTADEGVALLSLFGVPFKK